MLVNTKNTWNYYIIGFIFYQGPLTQKSSIWQGFLVQKKNDKRMTKERIDLNFSS